MGTYENLKQAQALASRLGERSTFDRKVKKIGDRSLNDFCCAYILAHGFGKNVIRNSTQQRYYAQLMKY